MMIPEYIFLLTLALLVTYYPVHRCLGSRIQKFLRIYVLSILTRALILISSLFLLDASIVFCAIVVSVVTEVILLYSRDLSQNKVGSMI